MSYGVYSGKETLVNERGDALTNFTILESKMFYDATDDRTREVLRLKILHQGKRHQVDLDLRNPNLLQQIQQTIPTCKIFRRSDYSRIEAHILELPINDQAQQSTRPLYFRQHGFHNLNDGTYVFVAGDEVLELPDSQEWLVAAEVARAHLAYDETLTLRQAVEGFWAVLKKNKDQLLPIWGFTLLSSMRSLFSQLSLTTFPFCAVIGGQGLGKTTICQRFSLLYDDLQRPGRHWAEIDAKSTAASTVDTISRYRDQVVLLDDLAKSISTAQMRERKNLLGDVLRFASNETNRCKMDGSQQLQEYFCNVGLIFTGEFSLDNPSDISRTITVPINEQLQGGKQQDRVLAATAFRWFILWMLSRIDEAVANLSEELERVQGDHQRLQKNRIMILWALAQFLLFVQESGAVTEQRIAKMRNHAVNICDSLIDEQISQIDRLNASKNLSWYILDGTQQGIIHPVSIKKIRKNKPLPDYYYIPSKDGETLYMRTEVLYRYFTEKTPIHLTSSRDMDAQLTTEGIVHHRKEGRAAGIRIDGRRYLDMRRIDLIAAASRTGG